MVHRISAALQATLLDVLAPPPEVSLAYEPLGLGLAAHAVAFDPAGHA
jgi:hypothetical protein